MKELTISLIIPAYNEEKRIAECLRYAIKNSGGRFHEIIVVDNGSTDRTKEIASSFKNVKVLEEKIKGVMRARQRGFFVSSGDIIAFVDADNLIPPGWYDIAQKEFRTDPNLVLLSGPYSYYDIAVWRQKLALLWWKYIACPTSKFVGYMAIFGNLLIRREILEKMKGLDTSITFYGDDSDTSRRASKFGRVKFSSKFIMPSSARRFMNQGWVNTSLVYFLNFASEVILRRPIPRKYKDFR